MAAGYQHHGANRSKEKKDVEFLAMYIALAEVVVNQECDADIAGDQQAEIEQRIVINDQQGSYLAWCDGSGDPYAPKSCCQSDQSQGDREPVTPSDGSCQHHQYRRASDNNQRKQRNGIASGHLASAAAVM